MGAVSVMPLAVALLLSVTGAAGGGAPACGGVGGYVQVKSYPAEGNPQYWAAVRDDRGVLYLAKTSEVLEYDGRSTRMFILPNGSTARSLAIGGDGAVYVGGQGEIGRIERRPDGSELYVSLTDRVPAADRPFGDVWRAHATSRGVFLQTYDQLFLITPDDELRVWHPTNAFGFSFRAGERIFALDRGVGLFELVDSELRPVPGGAVFGDGRVGAVFERPDGRLLVATRSRGLWLEGAAGFRRIDGATSAALAADMVYHGAELPDGTYALATLGGGLYRIDGAGRCLTRVDESMGLANNSVKWVHPDGRGAVWLALGTGFARVAMPSPFRVYDERTGLDGVPIDVVEWPDTVWVGTSTGVYVSPLVDRLPTGFSRVPGISRLALDLADGGDAVLVGGSSGVYEIRDGRAVLQSEEPAASVHRARFDPDLVLAGNLDGVTVYRRGPAGLDRVGRIEGVTEQIRDFTEREGGVIWAGGQTGFAWRFQFDPETGSLVSKRRLGEDEGMPRGRTHTHEVDGRLVFGTSFGTYVYDPERGRVVVDSVFGADLAGGSQQWVTTMATDADGDTWLVHEDDPDTAVRVRRAATGGVEPVFTTRVVPGSILFMAAPGASGAVWVGSDEALVRYDPGAASRAPERPELLMRRVVVGADSVLHPDPAGGAGRLVAAGPIPASHNALRVELALTSLGDEDRHRYRYRLEGFDEDWSAWTAEAQKEYTNLPPGAYRLRAQARDADGQVAGRELDFRVLPPWYRTVPAYVSYVVLLAGLVVSGHRVRVRQLRRRERELEELVETRTAELRRSERQYRDLFDNSNDIIFTVDRAGVIGSISRAVERVLGHDPERLVGRPAAELAAPGAVRRLESALMSSSSADGTKPEVRLATRSGEERVFEVSVRPFRTGVGPDGVEAVARDVTGRKELERRLLESRKMKAIGELAGGVAHDFNNLLTVVSGCTHMLLDDADEASRAALVEIREAAEQAARLTDQLLAFGRKQMLRPRVLDLNVLIEESGSVLDRVIGEEIRVELALDETAPAIEADPVRIREVLLNLVINARDAMPEGGTLTIATGTELRAGVEAIPQEAGDAGLYVTLRVTDTGCGMTPETAARVFEPFFTTRERGGARGAGLGLATVYGSVKQSGGHVRVSSEPGRGSTFTVYLPAVAAGEGPAEPAIAGGTGDRASGSTVLVVDDEDAVRGLLGRFIQRGGHTVLTAASGREALDAVAAHEGEIDVLVTDVVMPGMSGPELARRLTAECRGLRVVFISGYHDRVLEEHGVDLEAAAFLAKPFELDRLADLLATAPSAAAALA